MWTRSWVSFSSRAIRTATSSTASQSNNIDVVVEASSWSFYDIKLPICALSEASFPGAFTARFSLLFTVNAQCLLVLPLEYQTESPGRNLGLADGIDFIDMLLRDM